MSNPDGGAPPNTYGSTPAGAYGPGQTVIGEPVFSEANPPPAEVLPAATAFPDPAHTPARGVPSTLVDAAAVAPAANSPFQPGGYSPPQPVYTPPAPGVSPFAATPFVAARGRPGAQAGPPLVVIGLAAFAIIGGLTTFATLRSRGGDDSDSAAPTVDLPQPADVPADTASPGDPPPDPPPVAAPPPVVAVTPKTPTNAPPPKASTAPPKASTSPPKPAPSTSSSGRRPITFRRPIGPVGSGKAPATSASNKPPLPTTSSKPSKPTGPIISTGRKPAGG